VFVWREKSEKKRIKEKIGENRCFPLFGWVEKRRKRKFKEKPSCWGQRSQKTSLPF
jgi:hypothetical protein